MKHEWIDLHTHSKFSDGVLSPAELVRLAAERELGAISLTDHDCLDGLHQLEDASRRYGVAVLSGVELSCIYGEKDLHVLGYGVGADDASFQKILRRFRETREQRGLKIIEKLDDLGVHVDAGEVLRKSGEGALGRPHIAEALVEGGFVKTFPEAFERYLGEDCPAYVEKYRMDAAEAIRHIRSSGGLAFVAHPGEYAEDADKLSELLDEGFDGVEVIHPQNSNGAQKVLAELATSRGLLVSGGSDFHGFAGRNELGNPRVPYGLYERIRERLNA